MRFLEALLGRYFSPPDWLCETWFGVMMALTLLFGSKSTLAESGGVRETLFYVLGGNFSWGVIAGAMLIVAAMFERGRMGKLVQAVQATSSEEEALAAVRAQFNDTTLETVSSEEVRQELYRDIARTARMLPAPQTRMKRDDLAGALVNVVLVFLPAIPAVIPFLLIDNAMIALRVANGLLVAMLFFIGYRWAGETNANRWLSGVAMMVLGFFLGVFAELLGG